MTSISQILTDAYREAGITGIGESLDSDRFGEALRRFNVLFDSLIENELGEPLLNVNYGQEGLTNTYAKFEDMSETVDDLYIPSNTRLILNIGAAKTLFLPPNPRDGARVQIIDNKGNVGTYNVTINGNGRQIESAASVVLNTNNVNRQWFYRGDTANWVKVTDFVNGDNSPFPEEFDDFLVMLLAIRINPRHGAETSAEMVEAFKRSRSAFRRRYRQHTEVDAELALQRLPSSKTYWQPRDEF